MPVLRVRGRRSLDVLHDLREGGRARRRPQSHRAGAEVDVVREVVPLSGLEGCAPLGLTTDVPLKVGRVRGNTVLQLGEVGLEEEDLVLQSRLQQVLNILRSLPSDRALTSGGLVSSCMSEKW